MASTGTGDGEGQGVTAGGRTGRVSWFDSLSSGLRRAVSSTVDGESAMPLGMGSRLGPYTLEQKIGQGGMGAVYRARHARLPRPVAVKLMRTRVAGAQSTALFEMEVRQTSRLTHPSTVSIFDVGTAPDGVLYYVMEYIEGITLEDLVVAHGPVPSGRVVHVLAQVAHALAEAHELGLVHRDIKPSNILLCDRGGVCDLPKLVDFGLVADLRAPIDPSDGHASPLLGTPMYMAPEALCETHRVDARTDIYALGAVAYYMLTGTELFELVPNVNELIRLQIERLPQRPATRLGERVPPDLERIIMRCLAKSPSERPVTSLALRAELLRCLDARGWDSSMAEQWWASHGPRTRDLRRDGQRKVGTSQDDTDRIPDWQRR